MNNYFLVFNKLFRELGIANLEDVYQIFERNNLDFFKFVGSIGDSFASTGEFTDSNPVTGGDGRSLADIYQQVLLLDEKNAHDVAAAAWEYGANFWMRSPSVRNIEIEPHDEVANFASTIEQLLVKSGLAEFSEDYCLFTHFLKPQSEKILQRAMSFCVVVEIAYQDKTDLELDRDIWPSALLMDSETYILPFDGMNVPAAYDRCDIPFNGSDLKSRLGSEISPQKLAVMFDIEKQAAMDNADRFRKQTGYEWRGGKNTKFSI